LNIILCLTREFTFTIHKIYRTKHFSQETHSERKSTRYVKSYYYLCIVIHEEWQLYPGTYTLLARTEIQRLIKGSSFPSPSHTEWTHLTRRWWLTRVYRWPPSLANVKRDGNCSLVRAGLYNTGAVKWLKWSEKLFSCVFRQLQNASLMHFRVHNPFHANLKDF